MCTRISTSGSRSTAACSKHCCLRSFVQPCSKQALMWKSMTSTDQEGKRSPLDRMQGQEVWGSEATLLPQPCSPQEDPRSICVPWNNALLVTTANGDNLGGKKGELFLLSLHAYPSQRGTPRQPSETWKGHSWVKGLQGAKGVSGGRSVTRYISNTSQRQAARSQIGMLWILQAYETKSVPFSPKLHFLKKCLQPHYMFPVKHTCY